MSSQSLITPDRVKVGDIIQFKTISLKDVNNYNGRVVGTCDFERARIYGGVAETHLEMAQGASILNYPELQDVTQQNFLVVELYDGTTRALAYEWLQSLHNDYGNVELIEAGKNYQIRLYNVSADQATLALSTLRNAGFVCKLITSDK